MHFVCVSLVHFISCDLNGFFGDTLMHMQDEIRGLGSLAKRTTKKPGRIFNTEKLSWRGFHFGYNVLETQAAERKGRRRRWHQTKIIPYGSGMKTFLLSSSDSIEQSASSLLK